MTSQWTSRLPQPVIGRCIGTYALTSRVSSWVEDALRNYQPSNEVLQLVRPFAMQFHNVIEDERKSSSGLHDINVIELTYQYTLEIGAAILLAADKADDPVDLTLHLHPSRAGMDDHLIIWGRLLTGLECDPPIIAQFPLYLMMCQAFTFEPDLNSSREDYVYSTLTGVDWVRLVSLPTFALTKGKSPLCRSRTRRLTALNLFGYRQKGQTSSVIGSPPTKLWHKPRFQHLMIASRVMIVASGGSHLRTCKP